MSYLYQDKNITRGSFIIGDIQYPSNWLTHSTQAERDALGIVWVDDPVEPEVPYIPTSVTMDQAMIQLTKIPYDESMSCYSYVQQLKPNLPEADQAALLYRKNVNREDPLTQSLIQIFGWTEAQADTYFTEAAKL